MKGLSEGHLLSSPRPIAVIMEERLTLSVHGAPSPVTTLILTMAMGAVTLILTGVQELPQEGELGGWGLDTSLPLCLPSPQRSPCSRPCHDHTILPQPPPHLSPCSPTSTGAEDPRGPST